MNKERIQNKEEENSISFTNFIGESIRNPYAEDLRILNEESMSKNKKLYLLSSHARRPNHGIFGSYGI